MEKSIFLTYCNCGKRIAIYTDINSHVHGVYSCNDCCPKDSSARDGFNEAIETDMYDEMEIK